MGVKNRIIFLNDIVVNYNLAWKRGAGGADKTFPVNIKDKIKHAPWSRYLGPYLVAQSIEDNLPEWEVIIIDYFTKIDNFHQYINDFINDDTKYIATASRDGTGRVFKFDSGDMLFKLKGHKDSVYDAAFTYQVDFIALCSADCTISVWCLNNGKKEKVTVE